MPSCSAYTALYFASLMELVRRESGRYDELPLPWLLPLHTQATVDVMNEAHPHCIDCTQRPPTKWTPTQVATQVREAGLQGLMQPRTARQASSGDEPQSGIGGNDDAKDKTGEGGAEVDIPSLFLRHRVSGRQLLNLTSPQRLRHLGVPRAAEALLLPWIQRLRNVERGRNWGAGAHCCSALSPTMPTLQQVHTAESAASRMRGKCSRPFHGTRTAGPARSLGRVVQTKGASKRLQSLRCSVATCVHVPCCARSVASVSTLHVCHLVRAHESSSRGRSRVVLAVEPYDRSAHLGSVTTLTSPRRLVPAAQGRPLLGALCGGPVPAQRIGACVSTFCGVSVAYCSLRIAQHACL